MSRDRMIRLFVALALAALATGCHPQAEDVGMQRKQVADGLAAYEAGKLADARKDWIKAADAGNAQAEYYLGVMASEEQKPDHKAAFEWFEKASAQGHPKAMYNLALAYERGLGVKRDRAKAMELLRKTSASGDIDAQYMLGLLLLDEAGNANASMRSEAISWLSKAAGSGNPRAQFLLGSGYADGTFGQVDSQLARQWLAKAITSGVIEALRPYVALSKDNTGDHSKPVEALLKQAEQGDAMAQHEYAARLIAGEGIKKDFANGVVWLRKSAQQGYLDAQYDLGILLSRSDDPDYSGALQWLRKAASKGHARAAYAIGQIYADGLGVDKDEQEAVRWYRQAAEAGLPSAEYAMGYALSEGAGIQKDDPMALDWFRKAANHGHAEAAFRISTMYANGEGVSEDKNEKRRWECRAAVLGSDRAMGTIERHGGFDNACAGFTRDLSVFATEVLGKASSADARSRAARSH
jgi:TPR repeat protein